MSIDGEWYKINGLRSGYDYKMPPYVFVGTIIYGILKLAADFKSVCQ